MSTRPGGDPSLDELMLMAAVATRFYREGRTRLQIAEELGLSRFKVARLLEAAIEHQVVKIEIVVPEAVDASMSLQLRERFGLDQAIVVSTQDRRPETIREAIGRAAARLLMETVTDRDVLGLTSGRTIDAVTRNVTSLPACEIVQLTGMSGGLNDNPVEGLRRMNGVTGGLTRPIFAPITVATPSAATALRSDPRIAEALARFDSVTIAYASIGSWQPPDSRFHDGLTAAEQKKLIKAGVVTDIAGGLLDLDGRTVKIFQNRTLGITPDQLTRVPSVVLVGGGPNKISSISTALKAGFVTGLVTDTSVAQALLGDTTLGRRKT